MTFQKRFHHPCVFPNEAFIQQAIEKYFEERGFVRHQETYADLICSHPDGGERWVIEAKGHSQAINVDFNTALGQLLKRIGEDTGEKYGIALPATKQYARQTEQVGDRVRRMLDLHWLLVEADGTVTVVVPPESP